MIAKRESIQSNACQNIDKHRTPPPPHTHTHTHKQWGVHKQLINNNRTILDMSVTNDIVSSMIYGKRDVDGWLGMGLPPPPQEIIMQTYLIL